MTPESEANKALEALSTLRKVCRLDITSTTYINELTETVRAALTRLSELEPIIQELVEARKKATSGDWIIYTKEQWEEGIDFFAGPDKAFCFPLDLEQEDVDFIALAANRIAKIGGGQDG